MNLSHRELLEVSSNIENSATWRLFDEFVKARAQEKNNLADNMSEDLTKLLAREQATGAAKTLSTLISDFKSHVVNVMSTTKEKE